MYIKFGTFVRDHNVRVEFKFQVDSTNRLTPVSARNRQNILYVFKQFNRFYNLKLLNIYREFSQKIWETL